MIIDSLTIWATIAVLAITVFLVGAVLSAK